MHAIAQELPLTLFTTLAPIGAGCFIALAGVLASKRPSDEDLRRLDRLVWVPALIALLGFGASVLHLADPSHMLHALRGVGHSPLSNEIAAGAVFLVPAFLYAALGWMGRLSAGGRRILAVAAGLLAAVFAVFTGLAYHVSTILSWTAPWPSLQILGFSLVGGCALLAVLMRASGCEQGVPFAPCAIGLVCALVGLAGMAIQLQGAANAVHSGAALLAQHGPLMAAGFAAMAVAAGWVVAVRRAGVAASALACCVVLAGVFAARLAFYGMQLSAGLSL
ncbi:dimethyl sulfoxide reductase anchor subunit [Eggerthellaceae bacterium zg-997]|nr:dimethyl sulfoxide reductase anchor subunit [Eggerthellaceae bacterium zg-997]